MPVWTGLKQAVSGGDGDGGDCGGVEGGGGGGGTWYWLDSV